MIACQDLSPQVGTAAACHSLDIARATYYRRLEGDSEIVAGKRPTPPPALDTRERERVLEILHEDRFVDRAPTEIFASLLDEGGSGTDDGKSLKPKDVSAKGGLKIGVAPDFQASFFVLTRL